MPTASTKPSKRLKIFSPNTPLTLGQLLPVILTDNSTEFSDPAAIEALAPGNLRIFHCDHMQTNQKSPIERTHEYLLLSHINSYARPKHGDATPIDLFTLIHGPELLRALNIRKVNPNDITLKPTLLQDNPQD